MTKSNVIPFGKYEGQTITEIAARDPAYLQWLMQQNWFIEKFQSLVVNVTNVIPAAAEETPVHNTMQARFLDEDYQFDFVWAVFPNIVECEIAVPVFEGFSDVSFFVEGERRNGTETWFVVLVEIKPSLGDDFPAVLRQINRQRERLAAMYATGKAPDPRRCEWVLLIGEYSGVGATLDQLRQMFAANDIAVVMEWEID